MTTTGQPLSQAEIERLEAELRRVRLVLALRHLDELRPDEPAEIDGVRHKGILERSGVTTARERRRRRTPPLTRGTLVRPSGGRGPAYFE